MLHLSPIEVILCLFVVIAAMAWLASRVRVPYPIFLTLAGLAIGFVPGLPEVKVQPDVVFVLFLPPLIYYSGMLTSWRDFQSNFRAIVLLAVGLVLFTTCLVAGVAHAVIGISWASAFVLGAIISPPDAIAATAITQRLRIPKRIVAILEGESLVNDASALIAYQVAVRAVETGSFSIADASWRFALAAAGGIAIGYAVGWLMAWIRPRLRDSSVEGIASLLIPYMAYLPAEWLHCSGVLAAVTAGVYMGRQIPKITTSSSRLRLYAVWETVVFLLNGLIFILIGLALPGVLRHLNYSGWELFIYAGVVSLTAILVRVVWVLPAAYLPRLIPAIRRREERPSPKHVFLVSWVGLRGIVSLAAALALPTTVGNAGPLFPYRDLIIFITFGVILATLVGQGLTLPLVIRALHIRGDGIDEQEEELARLELTNAALSRLEVLAITNEDAKDLIARVREPYERRLQYFGPRRRGLRVEGNDLCRTTNEVERVAIDAEREMLVRLRDDGLIGDDILRKIQTELDLQEASLGSTNENGPHPPGK